jgi:hypothetical protein
MTTPTNTFVIHFEDENIKKVIEALFDQGIEFEILNPKILKGEWQNVFFVERIKEPKLDRNLFVIGELIQKYDTSYSWSDTKLDGSLREYYSPEEEEELIQKAKKILRQPSVANASESKKILVNGKLLILDKYKALYTKLQQEYFVNGLRSGLFRLNPNSKAIFGIFAISCDKTEITKSILEYFGINYDNYDWAENIAIWNGASTEKSWQNYLQKFFFPSQNLISNLFWFSKFVPLCVGVAIHDLVYGGAFVAGIVFCNLLPVARRSFAGHLKNLTYVSLSVVIFGIITGNYAGNWVKTLPFAFSKDLYNFLKNFQIIDITGYTKELPINALTQWIPWTSFGWQIFGFGTLGILIILVGFVQKLRIKIKSSDNSELVNYISFLAVFGGLGYWIWSQSIISLVAIAIFILINFVTIKKNKLTNFLTSDCSIKGFVGVFVKLGSILSLGVFGYINGYLVFLINNSGYGLVAESALHFALSIVSILVFYAATTRILAFRF